MNDQVSDEDLDDLEPEADGTEAPEPLDPRALLAGLLPEDFDWRELVRTYPVPALALAALGGYVLGRTQGEKILAALSTLAAAQVARHLNEILGDELV